MPFRYRVWEDFGPGGVPPREVDTAFRPDAGPELGDDVEAVVSARWREALELSDTLHDSPGFNLLDVDDRTLVVGPARFRHHYVRRQLLQETDGGPTEPEKESVRETLQRSIHLLSSFVAVVSDDSLLLGVKPGTESSSPFVSLPGSGYLDRDEDMDGGELVDTERLVEREVDEEIAIADRLETITCLGVFEDIDPTSHLNPSLFSVVTTSDPPSTVRRLAEKAPDADEFIELAFLPLETDDIEALIGLGTGEPDTSEAKLPLDPQLAMSHKTLLMLFLIGRARFGHSWFERVFDDNPNVRFEAGAPGPTRR